MGKSLRLGNISVSESREAEFRWNKTVNRIRMAVGLDPFPECEEDQEPEGDGDTNGKEYGVSVYPVPVLQA